MRPSLKKQKQKKTVFVISTLKEKYLLEVRVLQSI